jgi:hypothetical protein
MCIAVYRTSVSRIWRIIWLRPQLLIRGVPRWNLWPTFGSHERSISWYSSAFYVNTAEQVDSIHGPTAHYNDSVINFWNSLCPTRVFNGILMQTIENAISV